MKRFIYILAASLSTMFSCQELTIDSQPDAPVSIYIDALDSYSLAGTAPGRIVFNISSNTPWTIKSDSQWCLPSPAMSASSSLRVNISGHRTSRARYGRRYARRLWRSCPIRSMCRWISTASPSSAHPTTRHLSLVVCAFRRLSTCLVAS